MGQREEMIERGVEEGTRAYFAWLRTILTVSSGSLTLLIALRGQFVPGEPRALWLLQSAWCLLAAAVVLSVLALAGEHRLHLGTASKWQNPAAHVVQDEVGRSKIDNTIDKWSRLYAQSAPWAFVGAMVALAAFGVLNIARA